jgi:hypothetical protein
MGINALPPLLDWYANIRSKKTRRAWQWSLPGSMTEGKAGMMKHFALKMVISDIKLIQARV